MNCGRQIPETHRVKLNLMSAVHIGVYNIYISVI